MRLLTPVQYVLVKSNSYWPFSRLNKLPYQLAIRAFTRLCNESPPIHSAYLRHSVAEGRWEPGLSDIDLTILLNDGMAADTEFAFVTGFRQSFERLKRFFPMLGELEILPVGYMHSWCLFSMRGRRVRTWIRLCGEDFREAEAMASTSDSGFDRLSYALSVYLQTFMNRLLKPAWSPRLELEALRRLVEKVSFSVGTGHAEPRSASSKRKRASLHLEIIRLIEDAAHSHAPKESGPEFDGNLALTPEKALPVLASESVQASLVSLLETDSNFFAILDLDAGIHLQLDALEQLRDHLHSASKKLVVLGPDGFRAHIGLNDPYLYSSLALSRVLHFGQDPIPGIPTPPPEARARKVLSQFSMALAAFPHGGRLQSPNEAPEVTRRICRSILNRMLYIQFYCDTGSLPVRIGQLKNECRSRFADEQDTLHRLLHENPEDLGWQLFLLYKNRLDRLNASLQTIPHYGH